MNYQELRQWRDICEYAERQWYKFIYADSHFSLLNKASRPMRSQLWSDYMIQFLKWGSHPYSYYHSGRDARDYAKEFGWRLIPGWEVKIDFLEQITLFNRAPEDLPQPWRQEIWESLFRREELQEAQRIQAQQRWERRLEESRQRRAAEQLKIDACEIWLNGESADCPIVDSCFTMTGAFVSASCPNFSQCKILWKQI